MRKTYIKFGIKAIAIIVILFVIVLLNRLAIGNEAVESFVMKFGYVGIFLSSIASGFNLIVPIPIIGFYPLFIEAGLTPVLLVLTISVGMMLGDVFGYFIGRVGRDVITEQKKHSTIFIKLEKLHKTHPLAPILFLLVYAAVVPLPNELIVIPMAFMGYQLRYMAIALLLGNCIFNTLAALGFIHIVTI